MEFERRAPTVNYEAWMGLPNFLGSASAALQKAKEAKAQELQNRMELQLKLRKIQNGGSDFDAPKYEAGMRDDLYNKAGGLKSFQDSMNTYLSIQNAAAQGNDVSLLYQYIKSLDPGSAVREGEISLAQSIIPWADNLVRRFNNNVRSLKARGMDPNAAATMSVSDLMTPAVRSQVVNTAKGDFVNRARQYKSQEDMFKRTAMGYAPLGLQMERLIPGGSYIPSESELGSETYRAIMAPQEYNPSPRPGYLAGASTGANGMTQEERDRARLKELERKRQGGYQ